MKRLAISILSATAVAIGTAGAVAPSASALVNYCSGPGAAGCNTFFDGYRSYNETRSSKSGAAASYVCTSLKTAVTEVAGDCSYNGTFIRVCYYGGAGVYGVHTGSSNAWVIEGRDATASDATTC